MTSLVRGIYNPTHHPDELPRVEHYLKRYVQRKLEEVKDFPPNRQSFRISPRDLMRWIEKGKCAPPPDVNIENRHAMMISMSWILMRFQPENGIIKREVRGNGFVYEIIPNEGGVH